MLQSLKFVVLKAKEYKAVIKFYSKSQTLSFRLSSTCIDRILNLYKLFYSL